MPHLLGAGREVMAATMPASLNQASRCGVTLRGTLPAWRVGGGGGHGLRGVVWCSAVRCSVAWRGVVWRGAVWHWTRCVEEAHVSLRGVTLRRDDKAPSRSHTHAPLRLSLPSPPQAAPARRPRAVQPRVRRQAAHLELAPRRAGCDETLRRRGAVAFMLNSEEAKLSPGTIAGQDRRTGGEETREAPG